jgi:predicted transcriptional regulator
MQHSAEEAVLEGVFSVLAIPGNAQGGMEDFLGMALKERSEGRPIALSCGREQLRIGRSQGRNPGEVAAVCQSVLLCSHDCFLLISCEKSFAN